VRLGLTAHALGRLAERSAEAWLRWQGLRPIARNYRSSFGEIDLIMLDGEALVFVEVRYRRDTRFGTPAETVFRSKQERVIRTAERFLHHHAIHRNRRCRFDVLSITGPNYRPKFRWLKDAFTQ
jgi:putative endonuclease